MGSSNTVAGGAYLKNIYIWSKSKYLILWDFDNVRISDSLSQTTWENYK